MKNRLARMNEAGCFLKEQENARGALCYNQSRGGVRSWDACVSTDR